MNRNIIYQISLQKIIKDLFQDDLDHNSIILKEKIKRNCGYTFLYHAEKSKTGKYPDIIFDIDFDFSHYDQSLKFEDINVSIHYNLAYHGNTDEIYWFDFDYNIEKQYQKKFIEFETNKISSSLNIKKNRHTEKINKRL